MLRKVWNDNNNQDGKRPTDIIVKLYGKAGEAAAEEILKTTLNEANNWTFTKTDLPKFKNGVAYTYYWTEETQLPDYTVEAAQQNSEKFICYYADEYAYTGKDTGNCEESMG